MILVLFSLSLKLGYFLGTYTTDHITCQQCAPGSFNPSTGKVCLSILSQYLLSLLESLSTACTRRIDVRVVRWLRQQLAQGLPLALPVRLENLATTRQFLDFWMHFVLVIFCTLLIVVHGFAVD
jgi:hypothetical protein